MSPLLRRILAWLALQALVSVCMASETVNAQIKIVASLYADFAFEAVIAEPIAIRLNLVEQPFNVLSRYFTPKLSALLVKDGRCVNRTHEICNLDFAPLWASQDPMGVEVRIEAGSTPETVKVQLRYSSAARYLIYRLAMRSKGWRIEDIEYGGQELSLVKMLAR